MDINTFTETIKQTALNNGAALVGFAPISRFDNAPDVYNPKAIFPQTKTLIAMAVPQIRGTLKTIEEGTYWQAYNVDSYYYLNQILAPMMLRAVCMTLETNGHTAVPVHNPFFNNLGRKTREEHPAGPDGMISLRVAGVAAGLGEFGHHKLLLTPEFGPRQRVFAVLTDAELEPTPLFRGKVCDSCMECTKGCLANAIPKERSSKILIEDVEYSHAPLDLKACHHVHRGESPEFSPFWQGDEAEGEMPKFHKAIQDRFDHLAICVGRGCIRSCLDHLEKTGRIKARFNTPMIDKERWK